ncbi:hypothetical protein WS68_06010 [Burkholderia sp. TSV86]|nr:hypothetical protein WS68_06010 [Burkholderia sp. TSV86]
MFSFESINVWSFGAVGTIVGRPLEGDRAAPASLARGLGRADGRVRGAPDGPLCLQRRRAAPFYGA